MPETAQHIYTGKKAILTTKHKKADAIALPLKAGLGLDLQSVELDTDLLGTFTGEIERRGTPLETAIKKARMGMEATGATIGIANEGSFGAHPLISFIPGTEEVIAFIDDELGIQISEQLVSAKTNYNHTTVSTARELDEFLEKVKFPSHGLIVSPHRPDQPSFLETANKLLRGKSPNSMIFKGITNANDLEHAFQICVAKSKDGKALVETDMRAHMNPTRQRVLRKLAAKLARRLQHLCPECACPGWGKTNVVPGLPCKLCCYPSEAAKFEIHSCAKCAHLQQVKRHDGLTYVEPAQCPRCNP